MDWTDERKEEAKKLFYRGMSASLAAKELKAVSRSAVLGMWNRMGLTRANINPAPPGEKKVAKPKVQAPPRPRHENALATNIARRVKASQEPQAPPRVAMVAPDPVTASSVSLTGLAALRGELSNSTCRWPVGLQGGADQMFCGCRVGSEGNPYCEPHTQRAGGMPVSARELVRGLRKVI